jgi:hypothetical protein
MNPTVTGIPSLRDAIQYTFPIPWVETHGYHQLVAMRRVICGRVATTRW